jgi:hypothetical protein
VRELRSASPSPKDSIACSDHSSIAYQLMKKSRLLYLFCFTGCRRCMIGLPFGRWCATVIEGLDTKVNTTETSLLLVRSIQRCFVTPFYYHLCNFRVLDSFLRRTLEETQSKTP